MPAPQATYYKLLLRAKPTTVPADIRMRKVLKQMGWHDVVCERIEEVKADNVTNTKGPR